MSPQKPKKKGDNKENVDPNDSLNSAMKGLSVGTKKQATFESHGDGVTPRNDSYGKAVGGKAYGKHALMPVLVSDLYAEIQLPDLPVFDPLTIKIDATIVAVGKRRTGKTFLFRNLMYLFKDQFPAGLVISQTDELNKFWRDYVPKKYIFNKYDPEILQTVFRRQKAILNDINKTEAEKDKEAPFLSYSMMSSATSALSLMSL